MCNPRIYIEKLIILGNLGPVHSIARVNAWMLNVHCSVNYRLNSKQIYSSRELEDINNQIILIANRAGLELSNIIDNFTQLCGVSRLNVF